MKISIINYGCGNIGAIPVMLKRFGVSATIANHPDDIIDAEKIILPGVGAFGHAMNCLTERGFLEILNHKALDEKVPVLGICLGMQLLGLDSEETPNIKGLGWINGRLKKFDIHDKSFKIPHMGWNTIDITQNYHPLVKDLEGSRFYHVHSYHYNSLNAQNILATAHHGYSFPTIISRDNIMGAQFHPEKSHRFGLQLLKNFSEI